MREREKEGEVNGGRIDGEDLEKRGVEEEKEEAAWFDGKGRERKDGARGRCYKR